MNPDRKAEIERALAEVRKNLPEYVTLIVVNGICSDTLSKNIGAGVLSDLKNSIPNVFTPNDDGINDCFFIAEDDSVLKNLIKCTEYTIWDRWGREIYNSEARSPRHKCWDGRGLNNEQAPDGTYFYVVTIAGYTFKGSVTLLRH